MLKVVIVDDEKMIRDGLVYTMPWEEMQIEVVGSAENGRTALELIRQKKPNLVLTDIRMPEMDGIELLKALKNEMPNTKVIIVSGYDDFHYAQSALKYGAVDYLVKPVNADELVKLMEDFKASVQMSFDAGLIQLNLQNLIDNDLELYGTALRTGNQDTAFLIMDKIYEKVTAKQLPMEQYHKICMEIVNLMSMKMKKYDVDVANTLSKLLPEIYLSLNNSNKKEELRDWMYDLTNKCISPLDDKNSNNHRLVIRKAVEYIDEHYGEDISARKVAKEVFLNANYFSHLFKKIRKESFTDYLNKVRIQKAKELLEGNLYKVYEVSQKVGYSEYKYFSSIFKKYTGVTPTEYNNLTK